MTWKLWEIWVTTFHQQINRPTDHLLPPGTAVYLYPPSCFISLGYKYKHALNSVIIYSIYKFILFCFYIKTVSELCCRLSYIIFHINTYIILLDIKSMPKFSNNVFHLHIYGSILHKTMVWINLNCIPCTYLYRSTLRWHLYTSYAA